MAEAEANARADELVAFALARLPAMQHADGVLCHEVAAPDLAPRGRSLRYTLIALLGLLRAGRAGVAPSLDPGELKSAVVSQLASPELRPGDLGLLLWADARSGLEAAGSALDRLDAALERAGGPASLEGLELSWIAIGCSEAVDASCTDPRAERYARDAVARHLERAHTPSGLFRHTDAGRRARLPNFATQIYGVLALTRAALLRDDDRALAPARRAADRLIELQRPDGAWPWIYDVERGSVVEPYELYSVHQDAMAPMALNELAAATGDDAYREAAMRGATWIWGRNELGVQMLDREAGILHRSIRRRRPLDRLLLYANSASALAGRPLFPGDGRVLELNRSDRPYHLGWVLEAWAAKLP